MELCELVSPGEDSLISAVSETTGNHGFSHSSSAFGAADHERFSEMDRFSEMKSLQTSAQKSALLSPLSQGSAHWRDKEFMMERLSIGVISDHKVVITDMSSQGISTSLARDPVICLPTDKPHPTLSVQNQVQNRGERDSHLCPAAQVLLTLRRRGD